MTENIAAPEFNGLAAEIVAATQICQGVIPQTAAELWAELATLRNIAPVKDSVANAKSVLESFGEPWDDDYVDEDGAPSLAALEAAHALVQKAYKNGEDNKALSEEEDDEDDEIAAEERDISAETSLWNILTMVNHIREGRMNLNPEWQRSFVWKPRKQKALIESLLLGLPIPSFLIYKDRANGKMSVIDGRQRLETISRFTAPREKKGEERRRFRTFGPTQEGWKPNQLLNPAAGKYYENLPDKFRTQFDTRNLQVAVLDVPLAHLYQIFKRYNTGSVALNAAEIRNAVFQTSELHNMMFRLGGEHRDLNKYKDAEEREVGEDLRGIMKNKQARYGAYDFIGRFLAFRYETTGSVAKAIFNFMSREHRAAAQRVEKFRNDFVSAFRATTSWYEYPLTEPRAEGQFHAFFATIQMTSTHQMLDLIATGGTTEEAVRFYISKEWRRFANEVIQDKQNSTNFWKYQKRWFEELREKATAAK